VGNPVEMTFLDFAKYVKETTGASSEIVFKPQPQADDPTQRCPNITKARELLGWAPQYDLRSGLEKSIPYFRRKLCKD